jgi:thiol-disulfide isomerase/thioredoxin
MGLFFLNSNAQQVQSKTEKTKSADGYWDTKPESFEISTYRLPDNNTPRELLLYKESQIKQNINREMYSRLLREWGVEFWRRFPEDSRRFEWLGSTLIYEPAYFANLRQGAIAKLEGGNFVVPLDTDAKNEWKILISKYLTEAMDSNRYLGSYHLELSPGDSHRWRNYVNEKFDYNGHLNQVIAYVNYKRKRKEAMQSSSIERWLAIREREDFGLNEQDIQKYISLLKATGFSEFQKVAQNMEALLKLEHHPLQLKANSINGEKVDLKQFKGKLVLVDFWHPSCSGCIAMMPEIKGVYDKYKSKGFEVLSVCIRYDYKSEKLKNEEIELTAIKKIYEKIDADWPSVLIDGRQGKVLFEKYGWQGVPQVLLLDEEGKLIHFNSELRIKGGLERLVKQHFDRKSTDNNSGK